MEKGGRKRVVQDLEKRVLMLPKWQKSATLEAIEVIEDGGNDFDVFLALRRAGQFDLAALFNPKTRD